MRKKQPPKCCGTWMELKTEAEITRTYVFQCNECGQWTTDK